MDLKKTVIALVLIGTVVWCVVWLRQPNRPCPVTEGQIIRYTEGNGYAGEYRVTNVRWCPSLGFFDRHDSGEWRWQEVPVYGDETLARECQD